MSTSCDVKPTSPATIVEEAMRRLNDHDLDAYDARRFGAELCDIIEGSRWPHPVADDVRGLAHAVQQLRGELVRRTVAWTGRLSP